MARRCRMMSRIPPVSPASIMLVVRSSKTTGYWRMALASVAPPSTVVRTPVRTFWNAWFSWLAARISRHCTSGRPASIMTENWRKKIAMSLVLTLPEPNVGMANSLPFSRIAPGVMRSRRNCCASTCLFDAIRSPATFCPPASLPENVKTGMVLTSPHCATCLSKSFAAGFSSRSSCRHPRDEPYDCLCLTLAFRRSCASGQGCPGGRGLIQQPCPAVDHFLQLILVAGALHRNFQRDLFLKISGCQRLVERLHAELLLSRLHGGINLMDFVFADQISDGSVGRHDFHNHGAALAVDLGQQGLTHDAFQHQR